MTNIRSEIPAKYKWDLTGIYATEAEFEADLDRAKALIADFARHRDTMAQERVNINDLHAILSKACNMRETFKKLK